jgi:hypothetical protein
MSAPCPECGAPVPEGGSCRDHFHGLLLLESRVPGAPGELPHFYAVASYVLQHPDLMNYTADALAGLRAGLGDALDGRATLPELRRRARLAANGPTRITRRAGDSTVPWRRGGWPMSVADVCAGGAEGYADRVACWARTIRETLDADDR